MRALALFSMALVVTLLSCKTKKPVTLDRNETEGLPQAAALQKLRELLPTAEFVYCTAPKVTLKQAEISTWSIENDALGLEHGKGNTLKLSFGDISDVKLDMSGKYFYVKVFTLVQTEREKPHFEFLFRIEDRAKQVGELLLSLKKK